MFNWLKRIWYNATGQKEPESTYLDKIENGWLCFGLIGNEFANIASEFQIMETMNYINEHTRRLVLLRFLQSDEINCQYYKKQVG